MSEEFRAHDAAQRGKRSKLSESLLGRTVRDYRGKGTIVAVWVGSYNTLWIAVMREGRVTTDELDAHWEFKPIKEDKP